MNLRLKEIFKSDLDPNSDIWWAKDKVDKINHNFELLKQGGPEGPQGASGEDGIAGVIGPEGPQGFDGPYGFQGVSGEDGNSPWRKTHGPTNDTVFTFPLLEEGEVEAFPTPIILGSNEDEEVYLGDVNTISYVNYSSNPSAVGKTHFLGSVLTVFDRNSAAGSPKRNITLKSEENANILPISLEDAGLKLQIGDIGTNNLMIDLSRLDNTFSNLHGTNLLEIYQQPGDEKLDVHVPSEFASTDKEVKVLEEFKYNNNANVDDILISEDSDGNTKWVAKELVLGGFPIGSIIPLPLEYFNSTNFELDSNNISSTVKGSTQYIHGRGKADGPYAGWYLCNGQTWRFGTATAYPVPNLARYDWVENENNGPTSDNYPSVIGEASYRVEAEPSAFYGNNSFQVTTTLQSDDDTFYPDILSAQQVQSSEYEVVTEPYIINLVNENLYFQLTGDIIDPAEYTSIYLKRGEVGNTMQDACSATTNTEFKWSGNNISDWADPQNNLTGVTMITVDIPAEVPLTGWYAAFDSQDGNNLGVVRYWNATQNKFTQVSVCLNQVNLHSDTIVSDLNGFEGAPGVSDQFYIDTINFEDATVIETINGVSPTPKWFREDVSSGTAIRRYWNGSAFEGAIIEEDFIHEFTTQIYGSVYPNDSACDDDNITAVDKVYFGTNDAMANGNYTLEFVEPLAHKIYVNKNWSSAAVSPLEEWKDQNGIGINYPWVGIVQGPSGSRLQGKISSINSSLVDIEDCVYPDYATVQEVYAADGTPFNHQNEDIYVYDPDGQYVRVVAKVTDSNSSAQATLAVNNGTLSCFAENFDQIGGPGPSTDASTAMFLAAGVYEYDLTGSFSGTSGLIKIQFSDDGVTWEPI